MFIVYIVVSDTLCKVDKKLIAQQTLLIKELGMKKVTVQDSFDCY